MALTPAEAEFFLHHLFLPQRLPDKSDDDHAVTKLLTLFATAAQNYVKELDLETRSKWLLIANSISKWRDVYQQGEACEKSIEKTIKTMENQSNLLLLLDAQNCAVLITRLMYSYKFEAWEVSAKQEKVLAAKDSLIRDFPSIAVEMSLSTVHDPAFVSNLAIQLSNLAKETFVPESMEKVFKGRTEVEESRQSRHPRLVTEWFFTVLASCGRPCQTEAIQKRVRDEVNWNKALLPWRRSPMWNCMRAALQLAVHNSPLADSDDKHYKHFMLYFLSYIADRLLSSDYFFEYLQVLRTKIARRASKLDSNVPAFLSVKCNATIRRISDEMQRRWDHSKSLEDRQLPLIRIGVPSFDVRLPEIDAHLREILRQHKGSSAQSPPTQGPQPSIAFSLDSDRLPDPGIFDSNVGMLSGDEKAAAVRRRKETLIVFQSWVAENVGSWLAKTQPSSRVCLQLKTLIEKFWYSSRVCFSPYAELMSGVLLTIFELWVALDTMAIDLCPLLRDYTPEMKKSVYEPLLLRKYSELVRLRKVESYLDDRVQNARYGSMFGHLTATSLSVRLYDRSRKLQKLMTTIEHQEKQHKQQIREKFQTLRSDYERVMEAIRDQEHDIDYIKEGKDIGSPVHNGRSCRRCKKLGWAMNVDIERYEEILPESVPMRKALVYELQPDDEVVIFRDCLWFILKDILKCDATSVASKWYGIQDFEPLKPFARLPRQKVGLASSVKSHSKTHRHLIKITTSVETIIHPHTSKWTLVDLVNETGVLPKSSDTELALSPRELEAMPHKGYKLSLESLVRAQLGNSPYSKLIDTVHNTCVPQNSVIARQSSCPAEIHISEWCAFGSMRYGSHLQLTNLLRSLLSKECDLTSSATVVLVEQILHEAGSVTGVLPGDLRVADVDLQKPAFINRILQFVSETMIVMAENWKEHISGRVLLTLTQRLLSLNKHRDQHVATQCLQLIRTIRKTGLRWLERLTDLHNTQHTDCAEYIAVSVYVHDYSKFFEKTEDKWLKLCVERDLILQIKLEATIRDAAQTFPKVLLLGLRIVWPQADPSGSFTPSQTLDSRWYQAQRSKSGMLIHYNIATGSLLVGGKPLSILPEKYTQQDLYKQVLGDRLSNVVASDDPNMEYMTVSTVNGHQLYFGFLGKPPVLQIHAKNDDFHYVAILRSKFGSDLPEQIVQRSIPWLCVNSACIEFRSLDQPWCSSKSNWNIKRLKESQYQMESKESFLIDNHAGIGLTICSVLSSLELSKYIHISFLKKEKKLAIELPRYSLNFEVDRNGQLQCNELAAFVRPLQKLGTFYGLKNRLVLQDKGSASLNPKIWVLVPFGEVTVKAVQSHVSVDIDIDEFDRMNFYKYRVDQTLHSLIPDQLEGHLWKAYLHACTSSSLPDELTGRTGIGEAFRTLDDRLLQTCVPFSVLAQQMLERIAHISVYHSFYPETDARHMQQTTWNTHLSFMMQHDGFHRKAREITYHNIKARFLHVHEGVDYVIPKYRGIDEDLQLSERAMYVWQKYWPTGFIPGEEISCGDMPYTSRDRRVSRNLGPVFEVATQISSWDVQTWTPCDLYGLFKQRQREASPKGPLEPLLFSATFRPVCLTQLLIFDMKISWASLLRYCLDIKDTDKTELLFTMSMIVFGNPKLLEDSNSLLPFAILPELKAIGLPSEESSGNVFGGTIDWDRYDLSQGESIDWVVVEKILDECQVKEVARRRNVLAQHDGPADAHAPNDLEIRAQRELVKLAVATAWIEKELHLPDNSSLNRFDVDLLHTMLIGRLGTWMKNSALKKHCEAWEKVLELRVGPAKSLLCPNVQVPACGVRKSPRLAGYQSLLQLMQESSVDGFMSVVANPIGFGGSIKEILDLKYDNRNSQGVEEEQLRKELDELVTAEVGTQDETTQNYRKGLLKSNLALKTNGQQFKLQPELTRQPLLREISEKINGSAEELLRAFNTRLAPRNTGQKALQLAGLWPTATALNLLELISKSHREGLPEGWRHPLIVFARGLCSLQRIRRIVRFREANDHFAFCREVENTAHDKWNPGNEDPGDKEQNIGRDMDWLLFEIQNDMLIRPIQVEVAKEMIKPKSGVLQLRMGDGKSSVILPLFCMSVSASMNHLVRVIVLKSLAKETIVSLSRALSGLVQTPLYWLPFSRATEITKEISTELRNLWKECRASRGILLTLPEHLNSFRLIGNDQLTAGRLEVAQRLLAAQKFLDSNTRDIIDESDEVLKPAYELVYTNGSPKILSGAPHRWEILLSVLNIVQACAKDVHLKIPHGLEYKTNEQGSFATVRILTAGAKEALIEAVLQAILAGAIPTLPFNRHDRETKQALSDFIRSVEIDDQVHKVVKEHFQSTQELLAVHLLRGLFAWGFLAAAFEKRFFVNYGLDRTRCLSAVPYRSKGVAATAAEFAQPDMSVLYTALSYYYRGLETDDMRQALTIMLRLPDPSDEYSRWIAGSNAPERIRRIASINLQDDECIADVHKSLFKSKRVIDFFLRTVVLPTESKEYSHKLSSSAWDLCAGDNGKITGGFSGTCDSLLCDSMPFKEVENLLHFDAAVLQAILRERNRRYIRASPGEGKSLDTETLLLLIEKEAPNTSVIIDVGAQTLDSNQEVAEMWLQIRRDNGNPNAKLAAVFFDEQDEKQVVTLDGNVVAWQSSPYKEQLSLCFVLYDQHYCRGADLILPDDFAAAVLLGPRLPKDAFVQAAMRLRKLSESQSMVTFAPPEVDNDIRTLLSKQPQDAIDVADVVKWVIRQSCNALRAQRTLKTVRNLEWFKRSKTTRGQVCTDGQVKNRPLYIKNMLQEEVNKVEDLYPVGVNSLLRLPEFSKQDMEDEDLAKYLKDTDELIDKQVYLEQSKDQEQEQEREQQHEREAEREVERPKEMNAKVPDINKDLEDIIVRDRVIKKLPDGLDPAFVLMSHTSLYTSPLWKRFPSSLVATRDHLDTVKSSTDTDQDDFLRPVHWLLQLRNVQELILIGPHEAQRWMPYLRRSKNATLICYAPKTTRDMVSFDKLDVYTVPERVPAITVDPNILTLLRLFAGQLYFNDFEEYERFCRLLSIRCAPEPGVQTIGLSARRGAMLNLSKKNSKKHELIPIVKKWIQMRRKGIEWAFTDVGRVLNGEVLSVDHFKQREETWK